MHHVCPKLSLLSRGVIPAFRSEGHRIVDGAKSNTIRGKEPQISKYGPAGIRHNDLEDMERVGRLWGAEQEAC